MTDLRPPKADCVRAIRREHLTRLYLERVPFRVIAEEYGGTPQGVRSTVRKMIENGHLVQRQQPRAGNPLGRKSWDSRCQ